LCENCGEQKGKLKPTADVSTIRALETIFYDDTLGGKFYHRRQEECGNRFTVSCRYNYKVFTTKRQLFGNIRLDIYLCAKSEVNYKRLLPIGISRARASHHPSNFLPKGFNMTVKR